MGSGAWAPCACPWEEVCQHRAGVFTRLAGVGLPRATFAGPPGVRSWPRPLAQRGAWRPGCCAGLVPGDAAVGPLARASSGVVGRSQQLSTSPGGGGGCRGRTRSAPSPGGGGRPVQHGDMHGRPPRCQGGPAHCPPRPSTASALVGPPVTPSSPLHGYMSISAVSVSPVPAPSPRRPRVPDASVQLSRAAGCRVALCASSALTAASVQALEGSAVALSGVRSHLLLLSFPPSS